MTTPRPRRATAARDEPVAARGDRRDSSVGAPSWRRATFVMVGVCFVAFVGFSFVAPFLPLYLAELGVQDKSAVAFWSGVTLGSAPFCAGITAPLWGLLADRYGVKSIIAVGMVAYTVILVAVMWATAPWHLAVGWAALGLFGGFTSLSMSFVAVAAPRDRVTTAVGFVQAGQILGLTAGPALGGLAAEQSGVRASFLVAAVLSAISTVILLALLPNVRATGDERATPGRSGGFGALFGMLRLPGFAAIIGVILIARGVERSFDPVLPLYVSSLQSTEIAVTTGLIATAGTMATAIASVTVGRLARRWPARWLLSAALLGGTLACAPMAFVSSSVQLAVVRVVWGLLAGGVMTLAFATGGVLLPPERRASAFGLLGSASYYGSAGGSLMAGTVSSISLPAVFVLDALLYFSAFAWLNVAATPRLREALLRPFRPKGE